MNLIHFNYICSGHRIKTIPASLLYTIKVVSYIGIAKKKPFLNTQISDFFTKTRIQQPFTEAGTGYRMP